MIPAFNTERSHWEGVRLASLGPGDPETHAYYLTLSGGHVIRHTIRTPECIGRFGSDAQAEGALMAAGWVRRGDRLLPSAD